MSDGRAGSFFLDLPQGGVIQRVCVCVCVGVCVCVCVCVQIVKPVAVGFCTVGVVATQVFECRI